MQKEDEKDLVEVCRRLMGNLRDGNCNLTWRHSNGRIQFESVEINGKGTAAGHHITGTHQCQDLWPSTPSVTWCFDQPGPRMTLTQNQDGIWFMNFPFSETCSRCSALRGDHQGEERLSVRQVKRWTGPSAPTARNNLLLLVFFHLKKPTDNKTLIAILASCGALLIMIVILAVCASHHRKPYSENQVDQQKYLLFCCLSIFQFL